MRVKLEDVCERGSSNLKQSEVIDKTGEYPIFGASGYIGNIDFYHQEKSYVAVVKDGAGIGRTTLHPGKSSVIGTMQYLLPRDNVLPEYLYYVVNYLHLEKYYTGATIPHIYFKDYKNEEFNLDSLENQKVIVDVLSKCESVIESRKRELQLLDKLIKARFVEMFENYPYDSIIGDLTTISRGASPRPISNYITSDEGGESWIKIGDVDENDVYITKAKEKVTKEGADKSRRVKEGDFILSNSMSFGRPYILKINGCVHDGWLIISDYSDSFVPLFFYYLLRSEKVQSQFDGSVNGAVVKNLNSDLVRRTKVCVPPIDKQIEFVRFAEQVDKSKIAVRNSLEEAQLLFDSLMQEYFG